MYAEYIDNLDILLLYLHPEQYIVITRVVCAFILSQFYWEEWKGGLFKMIDLV
jgi:hypothetical protein